MAGVNGMGLDEVVIEGVADDSLSLRVAQRWAGLRVRA